MKLATLSERMYAAIYAKTPEARIRTLKRPNNPLQRTPGGRAQRAPRGKSFSREKISAKRDCRIWATTEHSANAPEGPPSRDRRSRLTRQPFFKSTGGKAVHILAP